MQKRMTWKAMIICALFLPIITSCASNPLMANINIEIESGLRTPDNFNGLDPQGICSSLLSVMVFKPSSSLLKGATPAEIQNFNSNLRVVLERMKSLNLENTENAAGIRGISIALQKIEEKSSNIELYDAAESAFIYFREQELAPYCRGWLNYLNGNSDETPVEKTETEPTEVQDSPQSTQPKGHFERVCSTVEFPNPNYDAKKGFSAWVNEPTIRTQQCSQVWISN